jgi:hypothetical protein
MLVAAFAGAFGYVWACDGMMTGQRPSSEEAP